MIEIKVQMKPATPAQEAQPEKPDGYRVESDGYSVSWDEHYGGLHAYVPGWDHRLMNAADFRKFAALMTEIAYSMEAKLNQPAQESTDADNVS